MTIQLEKETLGHVANRLQAALWREAIHLGTAGVASVEDVDKAVWAGPDLRWAAMGPRMLFHLGAGAAGMETFCERYAESFHRWWGDLGTPRLTPAITRQITNGLKQEQAGRSFKETAGERDALITAMLRATGPLRRPPA